MRAGRGHASEAARAGETAAAGRLYILHVPVLPGVMLALITAHQPP